MQIRFGAAVAAAAFGVTLAAMPAQAQQSIKIGWAISKTGPYVGGATITLLNPYKLWVQGRERGRRHQSRRQEGADRGYRV